MLELCTLDDVCEIVVHDFSLLFGGFGGCWIVGTICGSQIDCIAEHEAENSKKTHKYKVNWNRSSCVDLSRQVAQCKNCPERCAFDDGVNRRGIGLAEPANDEEANGYHDDECDLGHLGLW